jgi:hypothetical protein
VRSASSKYTDKYAQRSDVAKVASWRSNGVSKRYIIFNSADTRSPEHSKRKKKRIQRIISSHNFFKKKSNWLYRFYHHFQFRSCVNIRMCPNLESYSSVKRSPSHSNNRLVSSSNADDIVIGANVKKEQRERAAKAPWRIGGIFSRQHSPRSVRAMETAKIADSSVSACDYANQKLLCWMSVPTPSWAASCVFWCVYPRQMWSKLALCSGALRLCGG